MRSATLLVLLAGCADPPAPPATEPATSGGTLYVIDTTLDFFDDLSSTFNPAPGQIRVQWVGEQALRILLRGVDRGRDARLLGSSRSVLRSTRPADFKVHWPLDYLEAVAGGRFEVRRSRHSASLSLEATPVLSNDEKYVALKVSLRRGVPYRKRLAGTDLDAGEPVGVVDEALEPGTHAIPVGTALAVSIRMDSDRILLLLVHVASVGAP